MKPVLDDTTKEILAQKQEVARLKAVADQHPFYKYNGVWTRELQNLVGILFFILWCSSRENRIDKIGDFNCSLRVVGWSGGV